MTLITFVSTVAVFSLMLGMCIGWCFKSILYNSRPKRKRNYKSDHNAAERKFILGYEHFEKLVIGLKSKPQDTSWGNMSEEEQARLDAAIDFERWQWRDDKRLTPQEYEK